MTQVRAIEVMLLSIVLCACALENRAAATEVSADASAAVEPTRSNRLSKKRSAPEPVTAVIVGAIRYEVVLGGRQHGFTQDGGVIRAVAVDSGEQLWLLKVYDIQLQSSIEADKQERYIVQLLPTEDGRSLLVEAERDMHYRVDLQTREVSLCPRGRSCGK